MKKDYYKIFGKCYKNCDFSSFSRIITKDCTYQSFDYLYILKGKERVIEGMTQIANQNVSENEDICVDVYKGYYLKMIFILKTIKECCIITRRDDNKNIRLIYFNKRWGKISAIMGVDPQKLKIIRANKILKDDKYG